MNGTTKISKFISLVLWHRPETIGISLDESGWAVIAELVEKSRKVGVVLTSDQIQKIVAASDKQRFAISADGLRIRANQGHSITVDLSFDATEPPQRLYHGTAVNNIPAIRHQGLLKGNRQHVHLSLDLECAIDVGMRHGKPVVLLIDAGRMYMDGFDFFLSQNGVWLTDHVPAEYLTLQNKTS